MINKCNISDIWYVRFGYGFVIGDYELSFVGVYIFYLLYNFKY